MKLSYKDLSFIDEAISLQILTYQKELDECNDEDRYSDLANDMHYLENLLISIRKELLNLQS
jgi:hypothetical protein